MIKIGINGFGRIGRVALRTVLKHYADEIEVVAINTSGSMNAKGWAHLFEYDTVYRKFEGTVSVQPGEGEEIGRLLVAGQSIPLLAQRDPGKIPWQKYQPEVVLEATGIFRDKESAKAEGYRFTSLALTKRSIRVKN